MFVFVMKCQREPVKGGIAYIIAGLSRFPSILIGKKKTEERQGGTTGKIPNKYTYIKQN